MGSCARGSEGESGRAWARRAGVAYDGNVVTCAVLGLTLSFLMGCQQLAGLTWDVAQAPWELAQAIAAGPDHNGEKAKERRIRRLIGRLSWSEGVQGLSCVCQPPMIPGNGSAEALVRIGKPAVPHLIPVLTQPDRNPSWLVRKSIRAVEILGAIGDTSATPAILEALEARRRDALFIGAAVKALGQLRDPRALPKLQQIAELSFEVAALYDRAAAVGPGTQPEEGSEEARWWAPGRGTNGPSITAEGTECYEAMASIAPRESLGTFSRSLGSRNDRERFAAIMGLARVLEHDRAASRSVVRLLQGHLVAEDDAELQEIAILVIHSERRRLSGDAAGAIVQRPQAQETKKGDGPAQTGAAETDSKSMKAVEDRVRSMIELLESSEPLGVPPPRLAAPGQDAAQELVRIGKPAVPQLIPLLTQRDSSQPSLIRKSVCAVEILGAIGDTSAAPAILEALEVNRRDAQFVEAAVEALWRLRDRRALAKLQQIAELSFEVAALSFRAAGVAPRTRVEGMSEEATWWSRNPGIDRGIFALLGFSCYEAMAAMDPKASVAIFRRSLASENHWERLAAVIVFPKIPCYDKALRRSVLRLLEEHERVEADGGLKILTAGAIRDLRGVGW